MLGFLTAYESSRDTSATAMRLVDTGRSFAGVEASEALAVHTLRVVAVLVYAIDYPRLIVIVILDLSSNVSRFALVSRHVSSLRS